MRRRNLTLLLSIFVIVVAVLGFIPNLLLTASNISVSVDTQSSSIRLKATLKSAMFQGASGTSLIQSQVASIISDYLSHATDWTGFIEQLTGSPAYMTPTAAGNFGMDLGCPAQYASLERIGEQNYYSLNCSPFNGQVTYTAAQGSCDPSYVSEPMILTSKEFDDLSRTLVSPDIVSSLGRTCTSGISLYYLCLAVYQQTGFVIQDCTNQLTGNENPANIYEQLPSGPLPISLDLEGYLVNLDLHLNNESPLTIINVTGMAQGQRVSASFHEMTCAPMCSFNLTMALPTLNTDSIRLMLSVETETSVGWGEPPVWFQTGTVSKSIEADLLAVPPMAPSA